jgi:hypothetical protein
VCGIVPSGSGREKEVDVVFIALIAALSAVTTALVYAFEGLRHGRDGK